MDNDIVSINEGEQITEKHLRKAKIANKFSELTMNVK